MRNAFDGKICPAWWGWGCTLHTLPLSLYLPSRTKLWCAPLLRRQIHSPYFYSTPICTLWVSPSMTYPLVYFIHGPYGPMHFSYWCEYIFGRLWFIGTVKIKDAAEKLFAFFRFLSVRSYQISGAIESSSFWLVIVLFWLVAQCELLNTLALWLATKYVFSSLTGYKRITHSNWLLSAHCLN